MMGEERYPEPPMTLLRSRWFCTGLLCFLWTLPGAGQEVPTEVSADVAKRAIDDFRKLAKSKDARTRLAATDELSRFRHRNIAKLLAQQLEKDPDVTVRTASAVGLGRQMPADARRYLLAAFALKSVADEVPVACAVLEALRSAGGAPSFDDATRGFESRPREVQRELIRCMVLLRERRTVEFLADRLEAPEPGNVDDPTNPPADYWRQRLTDWRFWQQDLTATLQDLTGQSFAERKEVREWLKAGGTIRKRPGPDK